MIIKITKYHCLRCNFIQEYGKHDTPPCVCPACGDGKIGPYILKKEDIPNKNLVYADNIEVISNKNND